MRNIILTISIVALFISCNETSTSKSNKQSSDILETEETIATKETIKEEKNEILTPEKSIESIDNVSKVTISENQLSSTIIDFQNCKSTSEKRSDCRNAISKFISNVYQISDFRDQNNTPVIYDSIQPIISRSSKWKNIGTATNQQNIDEAIRYTESDGLALIIDTSETYGHIVVVQNGETKKSGSWGLKLPKVLSLSNHNPSKSFYNKSLAYAFKKSNDLQIYIRE